MAIGALVCGIVGIFLSFLLVPSVVAVVLGLVAASNAKRAGGRRNSGLGMARAGWILGFVGIGLFALIVTLAATDQFDDDEIGVTELEAGDCVQLDVAEDAEEVGDLPRRPCDEAHDGEVYHVDEVDVDGDEYPGEDVLGRQIEQRCTGDVFEDFVGASYEESELDIFYLFPVPSGWALGDREFACVVVAMDGSPLVGSVEGSGR